MEGRENFCRLVFVWFGFQEERGVEILLIQLNIDGFRGRDEDHLKYFKCNDYNITTHVFKLNL